MHVCIYVCMYDNKSAYNETVGMRFQMGRSRGGRASLGPRPEGHKRQEAKDTRVRS